MKQAGGHFARKQPAARAQNNGQNTDDGFIHKARAYQGTGHLAAAKQPDAALGATLQFFYFFSEPAAEKFCVRRRIRGPRAV